MVNNCQKYWTRINIDNITIIEKGIVGKKRISKARANIHNTTVNANKYLKSKLDNKYNKGYTELFHDTITEIPKTPVINDVNKDLEEKKEDLKKVKLESIKDRYLNTVKNTKVKEAIKHYKNKLLEYTKDYIENEDNYCSVNINDKELIIKSGNKSKEPLIIKEEYISTQDAIEAAINFVSNKIAEGYHRPSHTTIN